MAGLNRFRSGCASIPGSPVPFVGLCPALELLVKGLEGVAVELQLGVALGLELAPDAPFCSTRSMNRSAIQAAGKMSRAQAVVANLLISQ